MTVRPFPLVGGLAALALGGLLAVTGTALLPPGPVRVLAYAVAVLAALGMAALDVLARTTVDVAPATPSGGDRREGLATPGDDVDERLGSLSADDHRGRRAVRERVAAVGAGVLARRRNCSRERARELLDAGEWTDDDRAAALFAGAAPTLGERVRSLVAGESTFRRRVDAATAELERLAADADDGTAGAPDRAPDEASGAADDAGAGADGTGQPSVDAGDQPADAPGWTASEGGGGRG